METHQRELIECRSKCILEMMKGQTSGADVHDVNSMKHTAYAIIAEIYDPSSSFEEVVNILQKLEARVVEFFKKKYGSI